MLLKELHVFNYKSCKSIQLSINEERPTVLIGENDCGKTSTLNSVKFILEHGSSVNFPNVKSEKSDLSTRLYLSAR